MFIWILSSSFAGADISESGRDPGEREQAQEDALSLRFLARYPAIRVAVRGGDGNGHQVASTLLIKKIRRIGYTGKIELLYTPDVKSKLEYLLPPFRANGPDRQFIAHLNTVTLPLNQRPSQTLPLGLIGADESNGDHPRIQPSSLNVQNLLLIQPSRWGEAPSLLNEQKTTYFLNIPHYLPSRHLYAPPADLGAFLNFEMSHSDRLRGKVDGLRLIVERTRQKKSEFLSAYGFGVLGTRRLSTLLSALGHLQDDMPGFLHGPPVVGLISNLQENEWRKVFTNLAGFPEIRDRIVVLAVDDPRFESELEQVLPSAIVIAKISHVTQEVWDFLADESSLPPTAAGLNGTNFLLQHGKPFMLTDFNAASDYHALQPARDNRLDIDYPGTYSTLTEARVRHNAFVNALREVSWALDRGYSQKVADFIVESRSPGSEIQETFAMQAELLRNLPDRTCAALLAASGAMTSM